MEFHPSHLTALTLAGTVPLPSPYPACGSVSVVIVPHGEDFEVFVKIVQVVSDRRIITRFVRPEDVRAIRAHPEGTNGYGPESWPVRGSKTIQGELDRRSEDLLAGARTGVFTESLWYHSAIVYVPESAPVLHRNDVGVTAAVSAEEVGFSDGFSGCCHRALVVQPEASGCCHIASMPPACAAAIGQGSGLMDVHLLFLSRDLSPPREDVRRGIEAQAGVRLRVHRVVGTPGPDDPNRWETIALRGTRGSGWGRLAG